MHIIVDTALNTGEAEYLNVGDVAMLQVAVSRLKRLWPSAVIQVLTDSPENLARCCPGAVPLLRAGRDLWFNDNLLWGRLERYVSARIPLQSYNGNRILSRWWPKVLRLLSNVSLAIQDKMDALAHLQTFLRAMEDADLFVVCGAGGFADSCRAWNMTTLKTIEMASCRGKTVVMFGQGMGPLRDVEVLSFAQKLLPSVRLITLRGSRGGPAVLDVIRVDPSRVLSTGDEAIELAYEVRPQALGHGLGVNLRVAPYAGVDEAMLEKIKPILHRFARRYNVSLIPVPIAFHQKANDPIMLQKILSGYCEQSSGGAGLDTPLRVIKQVGDCRIIVTGAYHAAVFALAQGIPAVCLASSEYYATKFLGLRDQFGEGCEVVFLDRPQAVEKLAEAIDKAWQSAEQVRWHLQEAALRQIQLSAGAYERVRDLLGAHALPVSQMH